MLFSTRTLECGKIEKYRGTEQKNTSINKVIIGFQVTGLVSLLRL